MILRAALALTLLLGLSGCLPLSFPVTCRNETDEPVLVEIGLGSVEGEGPQQLSWRLALVAPGGAYELWIHEREQIMVRTARDLAGRPLRLEGDRVVGRLPGFEDAVWDALPKLTPGLDKAQVGALLPNLKFVGGDLAAAEVGTEAWAGPLRLTFSPTGTLVSWELDHQ